MAKIAFVTSVPFFAKHFLLPYMDRLAEENDVYLISNFKNPEEYRSDFPGLRLIDVPVARKISIFNDIYCLLKLVAIFRKEKFDVVHSATPKAGLLAMVSSCLVKIKVRFHSFTGQIWATKTGLFRLVLKLMDKLIYRCSTAVFIDSESQKAFLLEQGVVDASKSHVLGAGSFCGVDTDLFKSDAGARAEIRAKYAIPADAFVFLYLGRLNRDKGVLELAEAFHQVAREVSDARLLVVGPDEERIVDALQGLFGADAHQVICELYTAHPEKYMAAADVLCLPSHREGFGSVIIESAAVGIPSCGSRIYGVTDAIEDGHTGYLHEVGDVASIASVLRRLLEDRALSRELGENARTRARKLFSREIYLSEMASIYRNCLAADVDAQ